MTDNTKIEWADSTFNPWIGCTKIGPGCDNCYAEADFDKRRHRVQWGAGNPRVRTSAANWQKPLAWERDHERFFDEHGHLRRVFCASLGDVFDNDVPDAWRMDLFRLIGETPHLDWLLLTKRIGNVMPMCRRDGLMFDMIGERVWLGITVVNQAEADRDIPKLLNVPANLRFLSCEPLLGQITLPWQVGGIGPQCTSCSGAGHYHDNFNTPCPTCDETGRNPRAIHWVIAGGESGPHARPAHPDWFRSLRDQCAKADVPFLFKQWGAWTHVEDVEASRSFEPSTLQFFPELGETFAKVGKKAAGRKLDSRTHDGFPSTACRPTPEMSGAPIGASAPLTC